MQHAEDNILSEGGLINDGEISTRLGLQGIPALAEKIIVERDLIFFRRIFLQISYFTKYLQKNCFCVLKKQKKKEKFLLLEFLLITYH